MSAKSYANVETSQQWNRKVMFPKDNYIIRCREESVGLSQKDNFMVTLEWEIVNCEPKKIGDKTYEFDGVSFTTYHVLKNPEKPEDDDKKAKGYMERVLVPASVLGSMDEAWDAENPPSMKGKVVHACLYGKKNESLVEQIGEDGKKKMVPLKDPITQKERVDYQIQIETIYGVFDGEVRPF